MLLCVTPNPALDRTLTVADLQLDAVNRASASRVTAGGKGVNVARAAHTLGEAVCCAGFLGGGHGTLLNALLEREAIPAIWTSIPAETRTCTILIDPATGQNTVVNEPGPTVTEEDWAAFITDCIRLSTGADGIALCGSAPPGSSVEHYRELLERLRDSGRPVWVDVAGSLLAVAATVPGLHIKVNRDEIATLVGRQLHSHDAVIKAAKECLAQGAADCVVTLGAEGAILASEHGVWIANSPAIKCTNAVGSGDSFLAGLMAAQRRGLAPSVALAWASAAGAANAAHGGGATFTRGQFDAILTRVVIEPLQSDEPAV